MESLFCGRSVTANVPSLREADGVVVMGGRWCGLPTCVCKTWSVTTGRRWCVVLVPVCVVLSSQGTAADVW